MVTSPVAIFLMAPCQKSMLRTVMSSWSLAWVITSLLQDLCCDGGHRIVQPLSTTSLLCWPLPRKRMSVEHLVTCQNLVGQVQRFAPLSVTQNFVHLSTSDRQRTAAHDARYLFLLLPLLVTRAPSIPGAQVFPLASDHMAVSAKSLFREHRPELPSGKNC